MIEVAEELIEAVNRGQEFVAIAKMVLAVLKCHVSERLEQVRDRGILLLKTERRTGKTYLRQSGANRTLPGNEGRAPRGAALLRVVVGEDRALFRQPVDVGRPVSHHAAVVGAHVPVAHVIAEDHKNVRLLLLSVEL